MFAVFILISMYSGFIYSNFFCQSTKRNPRVYATQANMLAGGQLMVSARSFASILVKVVCEGCDHLGNGC